MITTYAIAHVVLAFIGPPLVFVGLLRLWQQRSWFASAAKRQSVEGHPTHPTRRLLQMAAAGLVLTCVSFACLVQALRLEMLD